MDLIRASLLALFYDYPIRKVYEMVLTEGDKTAENFLRFFPQMVAEREKNFSLSELSALKDYLKIKAWPEDCLAFPRKVAEQLLIYRNDSAPYVDYDRLFRWRSISKYVGEDFLTIPFLAYEDIINGVQRSSFCWSSTLAHTNERVASVFDQGQVDIHAHLGASASLFEPNWICLMNSLEVRDDCWKGLSISREQHFAFDSVYSFREIKLWWRVAAAIRVALFRFLRDGGDVYDKIQNWLRGLDDSGFIMDAVTNVQEDIAYLRRDAMKMTSGIRYDYALTEDVSDSNLNSPYMIFRGERLWEYSFYQRLYRNDSKAIRLSPFFYLYQLIKIDFRKEIVQTNEIMGLDNFVMYNQMKSRWLSPALKAIGIKELFAVQSSIRSGFDDALEARIPAKDLSLVQTLNFERAIFGPGHYYEPGYLDNRLSLVLHFIKKEDKSNIPGVRSYAAYRREMRKEFDENVLRNKYGHKIRVVGIDAAGQELLCRPEVFGHIFRYAASMGFGITYHVGEDFYDLTGGLRAIDEIVSFAQMGNGSRLGHALALGLDPQRYYQRRFNTVIGPIQELLDNLVWVLTNIKRWSLSASTGLISFLEDYATNLFARIGYGGILDITTYYYSQLLRSDDDVDDSDLPLNRWDATALCSSPGCAIARKSMDAQLLCDLYLKDVVIKTRGREIEMIKYPEEYAEVIRQIQEYMMGRLNYSGIGIECNPSSNLQVGQIDRYESHPIFRFRNLERIRDHEKYCLEKVSICTDDKGIFVTSLQNEFSFIALALKKRGNCTEDEIVKYLKEVMSNNWQMRFRI